MLAHLKRFGRIDHKCDHKCHHDHWPGSSACSSHLPRPGLLQRVSQVIIRPTDLKRSNSPHSCDWDYFFCLPFCNILPRCNNSCTLQGENKQSLWEGCQWLPITPWGPKEWYWCYFPSVFNHVFMVGHANTKRMSHVVPVIELQVKYKLLKFRRDNVRVPSRYH